MSPYTLIKSIEEVSYCCDGTIEYSDTILILDAVVVASIDLNMSPPSNRPVAAVTVMTDRSVDMLNGLLNTISPTIRSVCS